MAKKLLVDLIVDRYVNLGLYYRKQETQANGCINWLGPKNNAGYGFIGFRPIDPITNEPVKSRQTRMMTAHRLAFMIANGRLPNKSNVNHTCHNRLCLNPDHLAEGTQQEKMKSMRDDGIKLGGTPLGAKRGSYNHKQVNHKYKYSEAEIQWLRTADPVDIAKKYNIDAQRAAHKQWAFRQNYRWLPAPCVYEPKKRGRKSKAAK